MERKKAVALKYDSSRDVAPKISAKGQGLIAEKMIELAKTHGVPIHEDPALLSLLFPLELDYPIPETLYQAVAEVLAFIYRRHK